MSKINVLVLNVDMDGVGYYRVLNPHITLKDENINIDFRLLQDPSFKLDENTLKNYDILFRNKRIPFNNEKQEQWFRLTLKKYNIKDIFDIDDYWLLNSSHPNFKSWTKNNSDKLIIEELKKVDYVTTTTPIFADEIRQYNKNVMVFPNAVNFDEQQWTPNKVKTDKVRFLWGGGITHMPDLRLLEDSFKKFNKFFLDKAQLYLCGFDLRVKTEKGMIRDNWRKSKWTFFESIFSNDLKYTKNPKYKQWLMLYEDGGLDTYGYREEFKDEFYQRRWTKPILLYGTMYNEADVTIAPLTNDFLFNKMKSNLKIIESGAHKCPIIASDFSPYQIDDVEGKEDGKQKGFLIDQKDKMGWYEKMKWFVDNPSAIEEFGGNLYEYVKENYEMKKINKKRADFYKKITE